MLCFRVSWGHGSWWRQNGMMQLAGNQGTEAVSTVSTQQGDVPLLRHRELYLSMFSSSEVWLDLLAVQETLKCLLQHHSSKTSILRHSAFFTVQLTHPDTPWPSLYMTDGTTVANLSSASIPWTFFIWLSFIHLLTNPSSTTTPKCL